MPDNKEHNIFSKEELFKLIDEKKSLPPDADDFDKEAMEGLAMVSDRKKVDSLNDAIDEVLKREAKQARKKRNIYLFSAAASLALIIGLFFMLKDDSRLNNEISLADKQEITTQDEKAAATEEVVESKKGGESNAQNPAPVATGEILPVEKEVSRTSAEGKTHLAFREESPDAAVVNEPAAPPAEFESGAMGGKAKEKAASGTGKDNAYEWNKEYKALEKKEEAKKIDAIEKDADVKSRYITNAATSTQATGSAAVVTDETKNKNAADYRANDDRQKNQLDNDANTVVSNNVATPKASVDVSVAVEQQTANGPAKKAKLSKGQPEKPDTSVADMLAGYSYYDQKTERDKRNDRWAEDKKAAQETVQSQTKTVDTETTMDVPVNENQKSQPSRKLSEDVSGKKSDKHEATGNGDVAEVLRSEPSTALKGNTGKSDAGFIGGSEALQKYVQKNIKISSPKETGTVVAEVLIKKDGKVDTSAIKISSPIKDCDPCNKDVVDVIKTMPAWQPGYDGGKPTESKQKISIQYNEKKASKK